MTSASASSNDRGTYSDFVRPTRGPSLPVYEPFKRVPKTPGSKKLVLGEWVEVKPDDEDAIK